MNVMRKNNRALSLLTFALSLLLMFSLASVSVFAETDTEAETVAETELLTEPEETAEETTEATETTGATAETTTAAAAEESKGLTTQAIINLAVGGVLLIVVVILCVKFRDKIPEWFRSLKSECKKIVWCPKEQLKNNSKVVLITIILLAVAIGLLDFAFAKGIQLLRGLFQ